MKPTTRYRYEQRIRDLEEKVNKLHPYRDLATEIFRSMVANHKLGQKTNEHWIIEKFQNVFK